MAEAGPRRPGFGLITKLRLNVRLRLSGQGLGLRLKLEVVDRADAGDESGLWLGLALGLRLKLVFKIFVNL